MGIFGKITGVFGRKKESFDEPVPDLGPLAPLRVEEKPLPPLNEQYSRELAPTRGPSFEPLSPRPTGIQEKDNIDINNIKAKLDLLLTQMESVSIHNRNIEERLKAIEKMLAEMRGIRYY